MPKWVQGWGWYSKKEYNHSLYQIVNPGGIHWCHQTILIHHRQWQQQCLATTLFPAEPINDVKQPTWQQIALPQSPLTIATINEEQEATGKIGIMCTVDREDEQLKYIQSVPTNKAWQIQTSSILQNLLQPGWKLHIPDYQEQSQVVSNIQLLLWSKAAWTTKGHSYGWRS